MCSIAIKIPDEVLYDTKMTEEEQNRIIKSKSLSCFIPKIIFL